MLDASPVVMIGMGLLGVVVAALFAWACASVSTRSQTRTWAVVAVWLGVTSALSLLGVLSRWDLRPPPTMLVVMVALVGSLALAFSPLGRRLAMGLPLWGLVGLQAFRAPLELVMFKAHTEGVMPEQMSFAGYNFDVVSGVTALVLALWLRKGGVPRAVVVGWNVLGFVLLLVIMGIGVTSTPVVAAFGPERLNTWIALFPAVFLPTVLVPVALMGHILVFRRLLSGRETVDARPQSTSVPVV